MRRAPPSCDRECGHGSGSQRKSSGGLNGRAGQEQAGAGGGALTWRTGIPHYIRYIRYIRYCSHLAARHPSSYSPFSSIALSASKSAHAERTRRRASSPIRLAEESGFAHT